MLGVVSVTANFIRLMDLLSTRLLDVMAMAARRAEVRCLYI
jgi:hypothetical protein